MTSQEAFNAMVSGNLVTVPKKTCSRILNVDTNLFTIVEVGLGYVSLYHKWTKKVFRKIDVEIINIAKN